MEKLFNFVKERNFTEFVSHWEQINTTEAERQEFITEIIEWLYERKDFGFFVKICDVILSKKTNLDFIIEHYAPFFLALVAYKADKQLFDYFLRKGAKLNFIAETEDETLTCLDFLQEHYFDRFLLYNFAPPQTNFRDMDWVEGEELKGDIIISKEEYYYLVEQALYLQEIVFTDRLLDHMKSLGAKTYKQLKMEQ